MKKSFQLSFCTFLLIIFNSPLFAQWTQMEKPNTGWYHSIFFADANTGYITGSNGMIMKSVNAGLNWTEQKSSVKIPLNSVYFTNTNTGYVVGYETILKTIDGGNNWKKVTATPDILKIGLNSVFFTDANNGYIAGEKGTILKTSDAGETWTLQTTGTPLALNAVCFFNSTNGYAAGYGAILKTVNGGLSWTVQNYPATGNKIELRAICFTDINTGFIVGENATILKTTDAGINWHKQMLEPGAQIQKMNSICFTDSKHGYICGYKGSVFKTIDGGKKWYGQKNVDDIREMKGMCFTNANTGFMAGDWGYIYKTNNAGGLKVLPPTSADGSTKNLYSIKANDENVFIAAAHGLYKVSDYGNNWLKLKTGAVNYLGVSIDNGALSLVAVGQSTIIAKSEGRIFVSIDEGATWKENKEKFFAVAPGLVDEQGIMVPSGNNILYAKDASKFANDGWEDDKHLKSKIVKNEFRLSAVARKGNLQMAGGVSSVGARAILFISEDNGKKWKEIEYNFIGAGVSCILIDDGAIFVGTNAGIYASYDKGITWKQQKEMVVYSLLANGKALLANTSNGVLISLDKGITWKEKIEKVEEEMVIDYGIFYGMASTGKTCYAIAKDLLFILNEEGTWKIADGYNKHFQDLKDEKSNKIKKMASIEAAIPKLSATELQSALPIIKNYYYGVFNLDYENYDTAFVRLNSAIATRPNFYQAIVAKGDCYFEQKQYDKALKEYEEAAKTNSFVTLIPLAKYYAVKGNKDQAFKNIELYSSTYNDRITKKTLNSTDAFKNLKEDVRWKNIIDKISNEERDPTVQAPINLSANVQGFNYALLKNVPNYSAPEFLKYSPKAVESLYKEAKSKLTIYKVTDKEGGGKEEDWKKAMDNMNKVIAANDKEAKYFVLRGMAYTQKQDFYNAQGDFNKARALDPKCGGDIYEASFFRCLKCKGTGEYNTGEPEKVVINQTQSAIPLIVNPNGQIIGTNPSIITEVRTGGYQPCTHCKGFRKVQR